MADDDFMDNPYVAQAVGPLLGKQPTATPGLLGQLIPALIAGAGAALTSPIRSGPMIAGRALLGTAEGYEKANQQAMAQQVEQQRNAYYQDRLATSKAERDRLATQMANRTQYEKDAGLEGDDLAMYREAPAKYLDRKMAHADAKLNVGLLTKVFGGKDDDYKGLPPETINHLAADVMEFDYKNKHQPMRLHVVDDIPIEQPDGSTKPGFGLIDLHSGQMVGAPRPKFEKPTAAQVKPPSLSQVQADIFKTLSPEEQKRILMAPTAQKESAAGLSDTRARDIENTQGARITGLEAQAEARAAQAKLSEARELTEGDRQALMEVRATTEAERPALMRAQAALLEGRALSEGDRSALMRARTAKVGAETTLAERKAQAPGAVRGELTAQQKAKLLQGADKAWREVGGLTGPNYSAEPFGAYLERSTGYPADQLKPAAPTAVPTAAATSAPAVSVPPTPAASPAVSGTLPQTNLNPGVVLAPDDEIYTDGKTVFRARPGQGPTPEEIKELGLQRVK